MSRRRGGTTEGRAEGPVHATCEVIARRREGAYWLLSMAAREIAERAQPGQFVQVAVDAPHTLLRRPFSIAHVSRQGASAGTVDVVFDAHGPGTEWLTTVDAHDVLDLVGPLGTPFPLPQRKVNCLLVGGGYGVAPLYYLAESLLRRGLRVDVINGAATAERILGTIEAKRLSSSVTFTTEDGSYGTKGRVTDVFEQVAKASRTGLVYACGPNPMLRAVSELCRDLGLPVRVAVEERMACGIGVCFTCVVPIVGRDGVVRNKRACLDGPVFNGRRIAWDQWGVPGGDARPGADGEVVGASSPAAPAAPGAAGAPAASSAAGAPAASSAAGAPATPSDSAPEPPPVDPVPLAVERPASTPAPSGTSPDRSETSAPDPLRFDTEDEATTPPTEDAGRGTP